jgi:hypothetical protein
VLIAAEGVNHRSGCLGLSPCKRMEIPRKNSQKQVKKSLNIYSPQGKMPIGKHTKVMKFRWPKHGNSQKQVKRAVNIYSPQGKMPIGKHTKVMKFRWPKHGNFSIIFFFL